ncbi:hypothetical protein [Luteococcus sanguinis]|uniref:Uncharacterized protein n=1 Tax=Luteococcus sanguinis TaxID=174038 RepID=A0ABW1X3J7_9ACTN
MPRIDLSTQVLNVEVAADGTVGTPPMNDNTLVSWFDAGRP